MKTKSAYSTLKNFLNLNLLLTDKDGPAVYLGIDPGASGAIGVVCGRHHVVVDIPMLKVERAGSTKAKKKTKTVFDVQEIVRLFRLFNPYKDRVCVILETAQVQVRGKGANAYNGFRVGCNYGMWPLFLAQKGYPVEEVQPGVWKRKMGLTSKDKEASRRKAIQLFPRASLSRKKDHDRAEALLLAEYLKRLQNGRV